MKIILGKEKLLSQAPVGINDWGPWQFPRVYDGGDKLYLEFHISADSAKSYGKPRKWLCSDDKGETWSDCENGGMLLDNGDLIKPHQTKAIPESEMEFPEVIGIYSNYGFVRRYYDYKDIKPEYKRWYIERKKPGEDWIIDEVSIDLPDYTMNTSEGVFPTGFFHYLKKGPDGAIWALLYKHYIAEGKISKYGASWYLKSTDNGKTFRFLSIVPYEYDLEKDPGADKRYGFGEPDICFIDAEKAFSLHRTTDGTGIGAMYITWTDDGGYTWTKPEYFDERGVWPQTVKLENGVILAGYGRPGLFIRPYYKNEWLDRIAVVEPMDYQSDTCSYCSLAAISPDTALVFYSDFNYPDSDGIPRKSIMVRKVKVEKGSNPSRRPKCSALLASRSLRMAISVL